MKEFKVLPTDPRYQDLTEDQILFIYTQMRLDREHTMSPPKSSGHDPDYDKEDPDYVGDDLGEGSFHYSDPEFEEVWNDVEKDNTDWEEV